MDMPLRDAAMTALILGFFASCWFGWAQERPPAAWRTPLITATVLSLAVSATGAVFAWRHWSGDSALSEPGAMRQYGIILGVEFGVAAAGAAAIALLRHSSTSRRGSAWWWVRTSSRWRRC